MRHADADPLRMSEDQFLVWGERQEGRFELVEGDVVMQAGATRDHERVAKRIFALLYRQVDEALFDVNKGDFGVRIRPGGGKGTILYPDVVADLQSEWSDERATLTPVVIVEVLSPGTDFAHHVEKLRRYGIRSTLAVYAVFAQVEPVAFVWTRTDAGWPSEPREIRGADGSVLLPCVSAVISLAEVYRPPSPAPSVTG